MKLDKLVGLGRLKQQARRDIKASLVAGEVFPSCLLTGPGGTGKTAFSRACADELGYYFVEQEAASLKSRQQLVALLVQADQGAKQSGKPLLLFMDEVHRLSLVLQETFYYPMKEWRITTIGGVIEFNPFSLFAATTRRDMLDEQSFVARFQNKWDIGRYHVSHIVQILQSYFNRENIMCDFVGLRMIANRCLGIPRQAINLATKVRNQVLARGGSRVITEDDVVQTFNLERIDSKGLTELHVKYLRALDSERPRGLSALAGSLGQHQDVVSGHIEPILLALNMISMEPRGRILTNIGLNHLENNLTIA